MRETLFSARRRDFRVDTFRAGGKGGQHQNKTESGVRITHLPTGMAAESREHRSQGQNRRAAFRRLAARLVERVRLGLLRTHEPVTERVRTYHEPDNRVKDHASGLVQSYDEVLDDIGPMVVARAAAKIQQEERE